MQLTLHEKSVNVEPEHDDHLQDCLCKVSNGDKVFYTVAYYDYYMGSWSCEDDYYVLNWARLPQVN